MTTASDHRDADADFNDEFLAEHRAARFWEGRKGNLRKRLAAYRLGFLAESYFTRRHLFCLYPEHVDWNWGTAWDTVCLIAQMRDEARVLGNELTENKRRRLLSFLQALLESWTDIYTRMRDARDSDFSRYPTVVADLIAEHSANCDCTKRGQSGRARQRTTRSARRRRTPSEVPDSALPGRLRSALAASPAFSGWAELGCAIGRCQCHLNCDPPLTPIPSLSPILEAVGNLPVEERAVAPTVQRVFSARSCLNEVGLFDVLIDAGGESARARWYVKYVNGRPSREFYILLEAIDAVSANIQRELETAWERPRWDSESLQLFLGNARIKQIQRKNQAVNVIKILQVFEEENWAGEIDDPLPPPDENMSNRERLQEAVKSLNNGLSRIRFHASGGGERVRWGYI